MSFLITLHFPKTNRHHDFVLPGVNNEKLEIVIPAAPAFGMDAFALSFEVWENMWKMVEGQAVALSNGEKEQSLFDGANIACKLHKNGMEFFLVVQANNDGYFTYKKYALPDQGFSVGREEAPGGAQILLPMSVVSSTHAVFINDNRRWRVIDKSKNGIFVNSDRVHNSQTLAFGDVIIIFSLRIVFLGDHIAVNQPTDSFRIFGLSESQRFTVTGFEALPDMEKYVSRPPRLIQRASHDPIEIEAPPEPQKQHRQPLLLTIGPALTMVIPMAAAALMSGGNTVGIITSVGSAVIGVVWALTSVRYQKKAEKEQELNRVDAYERYLTRVEERLTKARAEHLSVLHKQYPTIEETLQYINTQNTRIYERAANHEDFLSVRIGTGVIPVPYPIHVPKERFSLVENNLAQEPLRLQQENAHLENAPVSLALKENALIGVVHSNRNSREGVLRAIAIQAAAYHTYADIQMAFLYHKKEAEAYSFAKWLPHVWAGSLRLIADDDAGYGVILSHITQALRARTETKQEESGLLPHFLIFVSDPSLIEANAISKYLFDSTNNFGATAIIATSDAEYLPSNCKILLRQDALYKGLQSTDGAFENNDQITFDTLPPEQAEQKARQLSSFRIRMNRKDGAIPSSVPFLMMYGVSNVDELDLHRRWLQNRSFDSLRAMVGFRSANEPLYLDIHERYHGPHGLVAGMTGSGKSETLLTYLLSLAIEFDPREVAFLLIDYKGGGMAEGLRKLPHTAGVITNLSGNQIGRALASVRSELRRRQAMFTAAFPGDSNRQNIYEYTKAWRNEEKLPDGTALSPIPHLLIVADEFAELKANTPEFISELVSAARIGRSLGIHLILATQKPSSCVDDEIWSNTNFRLCLRVASKQDSNDMLHHPDAAAISSVYKGRGIFQVGDDEIFELFQSGWSGASYTPEIPISEQTGTGAQLINLQGLAQAKARKAGSISRRLPQLGAIVDIIAETARLHNIKAVKEIWLPPLPTPPREDEAPTTENVWPLTSSMLNGYESNLRTKLYAVPLGLADDPNRQKQFAYGYNLVQQGHLVIAGNSGSGKTNLLRALLHGLIRMCSPEQLHIYITDYNTRSFLSLEAFPHCGGVTLENEDDKLSKLLTLLEREVDRRKTLFAKKRIGRFNDYGDETLPAIVFAIDNIAPIRDMKDEYQSRISALVSQSAAYGVYLIATCVELTDIPGAIRKHINAGIGLHLDKYQYEDVLGTKTDIMPDQTVPGRGLAACSSKGTLVALEVQFVIEDVDASDLFAVYDDYSGPSATPIPQIPPDLSLDILARDRHVMNFSDRYMLLGYDKAEAVPFLLDLAHTKCFITTGKQKSGKTSLFKALAKQAASQGSEVFLYEGAPETGGADVMQTQGELERFAENIGAEYINSLEGLRNFVMNSLNPHLKARQLTTKTFLAEDNQNWDAHLSASKKMFLFIHGFEGFYNALNSDVSKNLMGVFEQYFTKLTGYNVFVFVCLPEDDMNHYGLRKSITDYNCGVFLGGEMSNDRLLKYGEGIGYADRSKKLAIGEGYSIVDGNINHFVSVRG